MVYCSNCGAKLDDDANFCPKCGTKTPKGKSSNVNYPSDELKDAFYRVGVELERAFTVAAHETHQALKKAKEDFDKSRGSQTSKANASAQDTAITCPNCGTKNAQGAIFCSSCGSRLAPVEESHGSA